VKEAAKLVKAKITEAEKLILVLPIDQIESWIIPVIIGKGGQRISALSTATNCRIDVSRQELSITITGEDEESVVNAKKIIDAAIDKAKRECVFVQLPVNAIPAFIGKSGANIQQFAKVHSVEAERLRKEPSKVKITGQEDSVTAAKEALLGWIGVWEENNAEASIPVDKAMIPVVLGKDGSVINALQKDSGCRIDLDRNSSTITLRGGTTEKRAEVIEKINGIVAEAQEAVESEREQKRERDAERAEKIKEEKTQPVVAERVEGTNPDSRKDRTAEFAARPVGLSKEGVSKSSPGRTRNKSTKVPSPVGTAAGRNLFGVLVSSGTALNITNETETLSTSDISSNGNATEDGPVYYKSASGFTVRV
jgi:polyribonucleotide nucleotidyltransferase